jgi:two-component sensor histidine kinase/sensor domain CHASE-containing protein
MKLRAKNLLIFGSIWAIIILSVFLLSSFVLVRGFKHLEKIIVINNIDRVYNALNKSAKNLYKLNLDWAHWDDTYNFIQNVNKNYIKTNLTATTHQDTGLNTLLFYDKFGNLKYASYYDFATDKLAPTPKSILSYFKIHKQLVLHKNIKSYYYGAIKTPIGLLLIASVPILTSAKKGPTIGTLIMTEPFGPKKLRDLEKTTKLNIKLFAPDPDIKANSAKLINTATEYLLKYHDKYYIIPLSYDKIVGFSLLKDVFNQPIGIFKIQMPRNIYRLGMHTFYIYLILLTIIGLIFIFALWLLLKFFILNRVIKISRDVIDITQQNKFTQNIDATGKDELSNMAKSINMMINAINTSQKKLQQQLNEKEILIKEIHHRVKNNLQLIVSLLDLQLKNIDAKEQKSIEVLINSKNRIHALALLYEKLYKAENLAEINMHDYFNDLLMVLKNLYQSSGKIRCELKIDSKISLRIDQAIPLILITNELVTNAFKHAFPHPQKNALITISCKQIQQAKDTFLELTVSDNGIGLPKEFILAKTATLGMKLIKLLAKQLHGEIKTQSYDGLTVIITFSKTALTANN